MTKARFAMLARRFAPGRPVATAIPSSTGTAVTLDCGHCKSIAPHFHVTVGSTMECDDCGAEHVRQSAEFLAEGVS
jgi:hypothetical protein